jgi:hypothetical protein
MGALHSYTPRRLSLAVLGAFIFCAACSRVGVSSGGGSSGTSATLNWTAVTRNTTGKVMTNLAGYKVYYGPSAAALNTVVVLANPGARTYVVTNLSSGTWFFCVAAYTTDGVQGLSSNLVQKTIQ